MAHAILGYDGLCNQLHGHSYELHVSVVSDNNGNEYLPSPGFVFDFKELRKCVKHAVIRHLDHQLVLSEAYLLQNPEMRHKANLLTLEAEPTAENLLIFMQKNIRQELPAGIQLQRIKLFETKDSFAVWTNTNEQ